MLWWSLVQIIDYELGDLVVWFVVADTMVPWYRKMESVRSGVDDRCQRLLIEHTLNSELRSQRKRGRRVTCYWYVCSVSLYSGSEF